MSSYQEHNSKMKAKDLLHKTLITFCIIAFLAMVTFSLNGCSKATDAYKLECIDSFVYSVNQSNKIIQMDDNGHFMKCNYGRVF